MTGDEPFDTLAIPSKASCVEQEQDDDLEGPDMAG